MLFVYKYNFLLSLSYKFHYGSVAVFCHYTLKAGLKCFNTLDSTTLERVILGKKYYHSFLLQRGRMIVLPTAK